MAAIAPPPSTENCLDELLAFRTTLAEFTKLFSFVLDKGIKVSMMRPACRLAPTLRTRTLKLRFCRPCPSAHRACWGSPFAARRSAPFMLLQPNDRVAMLVSYYVRWLKFKI